MDDSNYLHNFELLLKKNKEKKPLALYVTTNNKNNSTIKPQDVLNSVYSQIKTIQLADRRSPMTASKDLGRVKPSFLTVNKLPMYNEVPKQTNTFETQCVSDTQLINITEDAEALIATHKGITQEFDTAFSHTNIDNRDSAIPFAHDETDRERLVGTEEFDTTFTQMNVDATVTFLHDRIKDANSSCDETDNTQLDKGTELNRNVYNLNSVSTLRQICDKVLAENKYSASNMLHSDKISPENYSKVSIGHHRNEDKTIDSIEATDHTVLNDAIEINDIEEVRSPSPVLQLNAKSKTLTMQPPPPLVVSLESFEKFERIALPLIDSNDDFDTCKHLVNSQILGGELCLNTNEDVVFYKCGQSSPIIEKSCEIFKDIAKDFNLNKNKDSREKQSDDLKDDILFSSDEENDFIYKEFQDMPLTAALESSLCDQSDVLEKTMYVGFQTASNKSIQICSDSFQKAQFILSEEANINGTDFSLTELVEICDKKNVSNDFEVQIKVNPTVKALEAKSDVNKDITQINFGKIYFNKDEEMIEDTKIRVSIDPDYDDTIKKPPEKQCFVGFKTASSKHIDLSAKALDFVRKVFVDIELDEKLNLVDQNNLETNCDNIVTNSNKNYSETDIDGKIDDDLILQEFENIEMSLEEIKTSCDEGDKANKGFKTASSQIIDISKAAKAKIKDIFQDIDLGEVNEKSEEFFTVVNKYEPISSKQADNKLSYEKNTHLGFKTANNKNINVSAQALAKTKAIFQDIDTEMNKLVDIKNNKDQSVDYSNQPSTSKSAFAGFNSAYENIKVPISKSYNIHKEIEQGNPKDFENVAETLNIFEGFKTASNKCVSISEQALLQSRKIFQDIGESSEKNSEEGMKNRKGNAGFKPADYKAAIVSKESTARSKKLLQDTDAYEDESKNYNHTFIGFQTASKKPVSVSARALELTKNIFQDINDDELVSKIVSASDSLKGFQTEKNKNFQVTDEASNANKQLVNEIDEDNTTYTFVGFKTASNKNVNVSKESLAKCKKILDDLDGLPEKPLITKESMQKPYGFQTASNKHVDVSKEALVMTKNLFDDVEIPKITEERAFKGFQTASKKKVEVSKVALEKTKAFFNDIDTPEITELGTFKGFQTASKKKVEVEAIEKTKAMFNDIDELKIIEPTSFKGFQTASKKKVEVSKVALEKTKAFFNDIDTPEITELGTFKGFQTASKKKVQVSKEALEKTKAMFNDIDELELKTPDYLKGFQTAFKKKEEVNEQAMAKSNQIIQDIDKSTKLEKPAVKLSEKGIFNFQTADNQNTDVLPKDFDYNNKTKQDFIKLDTTVNLDIINTQVLNNYEMNLCTEDFKETPRKRKRSASPILSCPRAKKKRRFETPYKDENIKKAIDMNKVTDGKNTQVAAKVKFTENYKKNQIYTLKNVDNFRNGNKKDLDAYITNFNIDNILNFEFETQRNEVTNTKMTIDELKEIFLSAVNRNLVPEGWLDNHLKLILWKLLSYESKTSFLCTVQKVIDQLKYRYDKELYNAERPALRKIFERDDVSTKTMVLCVAGIYADGVRVNSVTNSKDIELLLTDGWYFIKASTDRMLTELVSKGRITVGSKIVTNGAELMNCGQGMAPWEDTSAVRLKVYGNSTRPAPWHAKLGYSRAAILTQLSSVRIGGGKVSRLRAFVTRVYPLLYVEKFEDGSTVTRSERLEHLHQIKYEAERELMMERIYEEVQKEFDDQESQDLELLDSGKRRHYDSGSQIAKMMKLSKDPMEYRAQLTSSQIQMLQDHSSRCRDRMLQAIQSRVQDKLNTRNVVTLARGRIADVNDNEITKGMLSVWKPNDAILEMLKEGSWIEVMNIVPTAIRYSEIQITAGRQSMFRSAKLKKDLSPHLHSLKRTCYKISDVTQNPTTPTAYNEIDTVGIVFLIDPSNQEFESNKTFQNIYLADADKNIISVNFWGGVKKFGFENTLDTGQIVACANLQKRAGNTRKNIPQFRVTEFSHFTKTPRNVQARDMVDDINKKLFGLDRRKFCDDCVTIKNNYAAIRCLNDSENESPYRYHRNDYSLARNKMFIDTPAGVKNNKNEDTNFNLTGLDFESSFRQDPQELSPKTLLRKKKVNEKIAKLKMYGEPPPLSSINIIDKSVNAKNSYKSPLVSFNSSVTTLNNLPRGVSTSSKLPENTPKTASRDSDRERSPVISIKKAYIRSVPVKLNFENVNKNDLVDHFAGEFDSSPPLSLD